MEFEALIEKICDECFREDYYRFDLNLPKKIIGRGKVHEIYEAPFPAKPWVNGDCNIPIEFLEGALIEKIIDDRVIISFILPISYLLPFFHSLKKNVDVENDMELIVVGYGTVGNEA